MRQGRERYTDRIMMIASRPPLAPRPRTFKSGPTVTEGALAGAAIGSNWGTMAGAAVGSVATVAGAGYLGLRLGAHLGPWAAAGGAILGATGAFLEERKYHLGSTAGGFVGLVAGGAIGGALGAVVGVVR
jgi:hypothetical protein